MSTKRDYYEILGINKNASEKEIKKAYKKKAVVFHPDKQHGKTDEEKQKSEELFKEINEANDVLSDPEKRKLYDQFGHDLGKKQGYGRGGFGDVDPHDIFERMARQHFGGGMGGFQHDPRESANIQVNYSITLEEAISNKSIKKTFKYNRKTVCDSCNGEGGSGRKQCPHCQGTGYQTFINGNMVFKQNCSICDSKGYTLQNICKKCNGSGNNIKNEQIDIEIPVGAVFQPIQLQGKGNEMLFNGSKYTGHLIIQVTLKPHQEFQIDNQGNLHKELEVSIIDCIIGNKVKFKHLDGNEKQFTLKQGTKEGEQMRMTIGLPTPNGGITDLYLHIKHKFPTKLTDEQIKVLKTIK